MTQEKKPLRVRVEVTVLVDREAYALNYGRESVAEIREQVKGAVVDAIHSGGVLADSIVGVEA